jgi:hypothetical protein
VKAPPTAIVPVPAVPGSMRRKSAGARGARARARQRYPEDRERDHRRDADLGPVAREQRAPLREDDQHPSQQEADDDHGAAGPRYAAGVDLLSQPHLVPLLGAAVEVGAGPGQAVFGTEEHPGPFTQMARIEKSAPQADAR